MSQYCTETGVEMPYRQTDYTGTNPSAQIELQQGSQTSRGHQYSTTSLSGNSSAHFGDVYHQYYNEQTARGLPGPSPRSSSFVPFRRDRDFVERDILHETCQRASKPAARVGLIGLGGVGKTQLAIEYAYRRREADPSIWTFWVHASSAVRFEESYRQIAQQVHMSGWTDPKADVLGMVHTWLSDETNGRWTMVVDNADSGEVMFGSRSDDARTSIVSPAASTFAGSSDRSLSDYLPFAAHGSIVITSRSREVVEGLIEYAEDILDVQPMTRNDAVVLLTRRLKSSVQETTQHNKVCLVEELDYMPLAITQAAAYINQMEARVTLSQYLDKLNSSDFDRSRLLEKDIRDPRRDGRASNSIIITWHTSFEHIRRTRGSAARLLSLMSLFDREGIPDALLKGQYRSAEEAQSSQGEILAYAQDDDFEADFEDDVAMLRAYSLISIGTNKKLFDMHRLIQFSTRKWIELHGELAHWQGRYISILNAAFPASNYANWPTCQALFPHIEALMLYNIASDDSLQKRAAILHRGAWYARESGRYGVAAQMAWASLKDRERLVGHNAILTLDSVYMLALVLRAQGKYEQAEEMGWRALVGSEEELGPDHPDILASIDTLALILRDQGKYEQAEEMSRRAVVGSEEWLGPDHPDTLTSINNLALVLQDQAKYEQAEEMNRRALVGREKELGPRHPDTLASLHNLALVLRDQGRYEQAEEMSQRALVEKEKELGPSHPDTLITVSSLASILRARGKHEQAEEMGRRALVWGEKELGPSHPNTLTTISNLGLLLQDRGKYEEAEEMYRRALAGYEKELGMSHPWTLTSVYCLANLLHARQDYKEALQLYNRAIIGYVDTIGPSHPTTLGCQGNRRLLLRDMSLLSV